MDAAEGLDPIPPGPEERRTERLTGSDVHAVSGEGTIETLRCVCGHELERHLETDACDVEDCPCLGFEVAWEDEDERIVRV